MLEAIRATHNPPPLVFTSTNKVYGNLADLEFIKDGTRYAPKDLSIRERGIGENRPIDFHSPYGCSKGAATSTSSITRAPIEFPRSCYLMNNPITTPTKQRRRLSLINAEGVR